MLAKRFAELVLKNRSQAIFFAIAFSILPYFAWISGVIVALITLRKGKMEGALILLWSLLPSLGLAAYTHDWVSFFMATVFGSFLLWVLAVCLRYRGSWVTVLYAAALFGCAGVIGFHLVIPNVSAWWLNQLKTNLALVQQSINVPINQASLQAVMLLLSQVATGLKIMLYSFMALLELFFARQLMYLLFAPKNMNKAFKKIRLHAVASVILIAVILAAKWGPQLFLDLLPIVVLPFVIAGVSLVHGMLVKKAIPRAGFIVFYFILMAVVLFFPALLGLLVIAAVLDSVVNFRARQNKTLAT